MSISFQWQEASPESQGLSSSRLDALREGLAERGTKALLVIRNDRIVCEWYAPGHGPDKPHYTASLAKALVGGMSLMLAMDDGLIDADDPAWKYVPSWKDHPQKSKITVRHLATHSSGIEDAELSAEDRAKALAEGRTLTDHHMSLPGWKGAFWRKDPDPFTISRDSAPVIFEPGTDFAYSNPGMAMLAYAVTAALSMPNDRLAAGEAGPPGRPHSRSGGSRASESEHGEAEDSFRGRAAVSLQKGPHKDIRTLLRERVMRPIGVGDDEWSIGYGQTYEVDGLPLVANWGGGSFTARAIARVGRLMLRRGDWDGQRLVRPESVAAVVSRAGTPHAKGLGGDYGVASGLGWWTNQARAYSVLPPNSFAGSGAGNQLLLVIPHLNLIVVRNGSSLGEGHWSDYADHLVRPLMDAFLPPCPESPVIAGVDWAPKDTIRRDAWDSDTWPLTWGDDDDIYAAWADGRGFAAPKVEEKLSLGFAKISGPPDEFEGLNIRSPSGEDLGGGPVGKKASGMLMVDGVLYMWARNANRRGEHSQLAWSPDHARTWNWEWAFEELGYCTFLNFGRDYEGARDGYVYVYSHDHPSAYVPADRFILARVPKDRIREREAYEFLVKLDEGPVWSSDIAECGAVFEHRGRCERSSVSHNAPLGRYLWWQMLPNAPHGSDTRFTGGFGLFDAPEPWGPWTTVFYTEHWDVGPGETGCIPTKWIGEDGTRFHLVFSGDDYFSVRKGSLRLRAR